MLTTTVLAVSALVGGTALWRIGRREHAAALQKRSALLDEAAALFPDSKLALAADGFPTLSASTPAGDIAISLIADTLVTRRLPQLWVMLTFREPEPVRDFSLAALARPTGAEFYALTHDLPDWIAPPRSDQSILVRGRHVASQTSTRNVAVLGAFLADPKLKEAGVTPLGVRIVRQVSQGDRGAHLLLRQAIFGTDGVPAALVMQALEECKKLSASLRTPVAGMCDAA